MMYESVESACLLRGVSSATALIYFIYSLKANQVYRDEQATVVLNGGNYLIQQHFSDHTYPCLVSHSSSSKQSPVGSHSEKRFTRYYVYCHPRP